MLTISIGNQNFESIRQEHRFYIDKTAFIREWWDSSDVVTLITRPRRFGKTLTISMLDSFFSISDKKKDELFYDLEIWKDEKYRKMQGTYPVISLSFANIKNANYEDVRLGICDCIVKQYNKYSFLTKGSLLTQNEKDSFAKVSLDMPDSIAIDALNKLSDYLERYYKQKVIILLDEYDTPMQEAYVDGFWTELSVFMRGLLNATFKTNLSMERGLLTGITRVSKESIFSDLNNLKVITTTTEKYTDIFGFTQQEVDKALKEADLTKETKKVKDWYDGFIFGTKEGIYNPWSITNYLDNHGKIEAYWANTSSNSLVSKLVREGTVNLKNKMEDLLQGETIQTILEEQISFEQLETDSHAVWSLLLACGYLKAIEVHFDSENGDTNYTLKITNKEVQIMFRKLIKGWFAQTSDSYNDFVKALLLNDVKAMNHYMNKVALATFSYFDVGNRPSEQAEPERFYHGFVLGLMVELAEQYQIQSNRESGFGRYDVMLIPKEKNGNAYIIEFKVQDYDEKSLEETAKNALQQIEEKEYQTTLINQGIQNEKIKKYGFAFAGKKVVILDNQAFLKK